MFRANYASDIRHPLKLTPHLPVLVMVRESELIEVKCDQFGLDAAVWRIPLTQ